MKRILWIVFGFMYSVVSFALTIPKGTLYFDNSKTNYNSVCFVIGCDQPAFSYVWTMTQDGDKWRVNIQEEIPDVYRFTFVGAPVETGYYNQSFSAFKDSISHQLSLNRTATSDAQMNTNDIFVPSSGDNWAQGSWMSLAAWVASKGGGGSGQAKISGTLPVVYVNTQNNSAINDTETQIKATIYIDSILPEYRSLGSPSMPITGTIKGRGNYTWRDFDKKPYKIKFDQKQKVLGMPNNRHWCLMANTDDNLGYLRMPAGFHISKGLALRWTPRMRPVEFVLNGKYMGLYFLTEHVRIASNRVNIHEQEDLETHPDSITGGWLVEIDNYYSDNNISFTEGNGQYVMISLREPEVLSSPQRKYLENQLLTINNALYEKSSTHLEQILDMDEAAKFYLVQEIMEDCESYHGSCFLYKDRDSIGVQDKWKFGPVWDFGNAYMRYQEKWIYDNPIWPQYWIGQLAQWPVFQQKVKENWWIYYHTQKDEVRSMIEETALLISDAAKNDAAVWRNTKGYNDNSNLSGKLNDFLQRYDWRINWLYSQWGEGIKPVTWDIENTIVPTQNIQTRKILHNGELHIIRGGNTYTIQGQRIE